MHIASCLLIGCGGIGSLLVRPLVRLLSWHKEGCVEIVLADGDIYLANNRTRQLFSEDKIGKNKAVATAEELHNEGFYHVDAIADYLTQETIKGYIKALPEPILVIPAVDNNQSRKEFLLGLDSSNKDYLWVCPGNEYETFKVSFYSYSKQRKKASIHPFVTYPNLSNPTDKIPNSCQEEAPSTPQLLAANFEAASSTLRLVSNILDDENVTTMIEGNIKNLTNEAYGIFRLKEVW